MSYKTWIAALTLYLSLFFLVGPWADYNTLKQQEEEGVVIHDSIFSLKGALINDTRLSACFSGVVDGESGDIFIDLNVQTIQKKWQKREQVINLRRSDYTNECSLDYDESIKVRFVEHSFTPSYIIRRALKKFESSDNTEQAILLLRRYEFSDIDERMFGFYLSEDNSKYYGGRVIVIRINHGYVKKIDSTIGDYVLALIKDFVLMPIRWFNVIDYLLSGAS